MGELLPFTKDTLPEVKKLVGNGGGGNMDDRVDKLEKAVVEIKIDISAIKAHMPHLATKSSVESIAAQMPFLATKASVDAIASQMPFLATKAELHDLKASLIQWMVGTMLASAGLAAAIAFGLARLIKG